MVRLHVADISNDTSLLHRILCYKEARSNDILLSCALRAYLSWHRVIYDTFLAAHGGGLVRGSLDTFTCLDTVLLHCNIAFPAETLQNLMRN